MALIGLGVSGGIGAYKAVELARLLQKRGHDVQAVMTRAAARFVGPVTFEAITRRPVITGQWKPGANADIEHISIATDIALLVVAPATANVIGKFAAGIADDFLSSLYLATTAPVLLAPAMNTNMLAHPAVQKNLAELAARGVKFVDPGEGYLACGWIGKGRLAEPEMIAEGVDRVLSSRQSLAGTRVIVTAGPTYEDLDPVRFIGNRSSGKMGYALAAELAARGAAVTLVTGPTSLTAPAVASIARVRSARDMHDAVMAALPRADALVMAAAVANYTAASVAGQKIAHDDGTLNLQLVPTADILADAAAWRRRGGTQRPLLVGFAAETSQLLERARAKRVRKGIDVIVANDVAQPGAGFEVDTNQVTIIDGAGEETLPLQSKSAVAAALADRLERWLQPAPAGTRASDPRDLSAHLKYYRELGVDGISRDAAWRQRDGGRQADPGLSAAVVAPVESVQSAPAWASPDHVLELHELREEIGDCTRCKLHKGRTNLVFGVGDPHARLMFIGEGPGADEDLKGEPFVGRAGQLLTQIIKAMGLSREQVYIANVVKCRPPENRNPEPDEIEQCSPFLRAQIASVNPAVIVALGKFAAQTLLGVETPISRMRGQFHQMGSVAVMPTFHPSYLLRNPGAKREVWEDMKTVMARLANPPGADE